MVALYGLDAVSAACATALDEEVVSSAHVVNLLHRAAQPPRPALLQVPEALRLKHEPLADRGGSVFSDRSISGRTALYWRHERSSTDEKKPRRNHSPAFKERMTLEVLRGEKTLAQLSARHEVHVMQLTSWKNELLEGAAGIFGGGAAESGADQVRIRELHEKIGELSMERDFDAVGRLTRHSRPCDDLGCIPAMSQ